MRDRHPALGDNSGVYPSADGKGRRWSAGGACVVLASDSADCSESGEASRSFRDSETMILARVITMRCVPSPTDVFPNFVLDRCFSWREAHMSRGNG